MALRHNILYCSYNNISICCSLSIFKIEKNKKIKTQNTEKSKELFVCFYLLKSVFSKNYLLILSISLVNYYWFFNYIIYNIVILKFLILILTKNVTSNESIY